MMALLYIFFFFLIGFVISILCMLFYKKIGVYKYNRDFPPIFLVFLIWPIAWLIIPIGLIDWIEQKVSGVKPTDRSDLRY